MITTSGGRRICRYLIIPSSEDDLINKLKSGVWLVRDMHRLQGFMGSHSEKNDPKDSQDLCDDDKIIPGVNVSYDQEKIQKQFIRKLRCISALGMMT